MKIVARGWMVVGGTLMRPEDAIHSRSSWGSTIGSSCSTTLSPPGSAKTGQLTYTMSTGHRMYLKRSRFAFLFLREIEAILEVVEDKFFIPASFRGCRTQRAVSRNFHAVGWLLQNKVTPPPSLRHSMRILHGTACALTTQAHIAKPIA